MTLGDLIEWCKARPGLTLKRRFENPHSYRGYYDELAFEVAEGTMSTKELLSVAERCIGRGFDGYKGGRFFMHEETPLWMATYGNTGESLGVLVLDLLL